MTNTNEHAWTTIAAENVATSLTPKRPSSNYLVFSGLDGIIKTSTAKTQKEHTDRDGATSQTTDNAHSITEPQLVAVTTVQLSLRTLVSLPTRSNQNNPNK